MRRFLLWFTTILLTACGIQPQAVSVKGGSSMGTPTAWRLEKRTPLGATPTYYTVANIIEALDRFEVDANGSCRDAQFKALASSIGVSSLDIVTLQGSDNGTFSDVVNYYAGRTVAHPGTKSFETGGFETVGLKERLKKASPPKDFYAGGDIGTVFQNVASDLITNGGIGTALVYDSSLIPTQSATIGDVTNAGGSSWDLFESISKTKNTLVWGVNADRKLFQKVPSGSVSLTEGPNVEVNFKTIDASQIINQIDWIVNLPDTDRVLRYSSKDTTSQATYGVEFISANVPAEFKVATEMAGTLSFPGGFSLDAGSGVDEITLVADSPIQPSRGNDKSSNSFYSVRRPSTLAISQTATITTRVTLTTATGANYLYVDFRPFAALGPTTVINSLTADVAEKTGNQKTLTLSKRQANAFVADPSLTAHEFSIAGNATNTSGAATSGFDLYVRTFDFFAYSLDTTLLDTIAQNLYRAAPQDPATIRVTGQWVSPVPSVTITTLAYGALTRVAKVFRYGVSAEDGFWTEIELEQEYDAQKSLDAALENQKDNAAKMNAARFATKVVR